MSLANLLLAVHRVRVQLTNPLLEAALKNEKKKKWGRKRGKDRERDVGLIVIRQ